MDETNNTSPKQSQKSLKSASSESMMAMGKMLSEIFDVSLEEAVEVIAIQLTNGFELNLPSMSGRALYPKISFINHSCVPNMAHSHRVVGKQFLHVESGKAAKEDVNGNEPENHSHLRFYLELKGQRRVPAGTELTIRYNSVFEGFAQRQRTFTHEWFFQCSCPRCSDITEFGTFTSAVKCFQCSKGFVIPYPTLLNSNLKGRIKKS